MTAQRAERASQPTEIWVNGARTQTAAADLAALLTELGYADQKVATAVDGTFVPSALRAETQVASGIRVEIVAPRQGG